MTTFPRSPRLLNGAIIGIGKFNPLASVIVFQYNLETLTRRLEAWSMGGESGDRNEVFRLARSGDRPEQTEIMWEIWDKHMRKCAG